MKLKYKGQVAEAEIGQVSNSGELILILANALTTNQLNLN
jgi:hypothetical protein